MANTKQNSFNDKSKIAVITAVYPDTKTVDIQYTSQAGDYKNLNLPYTIVGSTWGVLFMPLKGDKCLVDTSDGDRPVIKTMYSSSVSLLPYLDPGEVAFMAENGSYIHAKNQRKRAVSSDTLLDYDANEGPNGATDLQYEPSGLILRVRTKQNRDQNAPRWNLHSSFSLYDNGDINLQSMVNSTPKGLLHMDGKTGYVFLMAGDSKIQEYIEMNPIKKEVLYFTDGEEHHHIQTNKKENIYSNIIQNIGGGIQIQLGVDLSTIPPSFDSIMADKVGPGDIYIDNSTTKGIGKATIHLKGDFDVVTDTGNINITASQGTVNVTAQGNITAATQGNLTANVSGNTSINTTGNTTINSDGVVDVQGSAVNISSTGGDVNYNSSGSLNINGNSPVYIKSDGNIFLGNDGTDSIVRKSTFDEHIHVAGPPDLTGPPQTPAPVTQVRAS